MPRFRKKPVQIEAVQWNQPGDHPEVRDCGPELIYSESGRYAYLREFSIRADCWIDLQADEHKPFAFWKVKDGRHVPLAEASQEDRDRVISCLQDEPDLRNWGIVETPEGNMTVSPGDWIITGVKGETYPCKPDIFEETYEAA